MVHQLAATFVPGGYDDDYYLPEVIAPAPQRVTPQVPQNMQDGLQRLEINSADIDHASGPNRKQHQLQREPSLSHFQGQSGYAQQDDRSARGVPSSSRKMSSDAPTFSLFPKVKGENLPPTDEEKEQILWKARDHVLHSQKVSMQIAWARDVLNWAEIAMEAAAREEPPRPSTPRIEHELRSDATNIITYLTGQDHPQALYINAKWMEFGKFGERVDKQAAYAKYARSAELGHVRSEYRMGMLFEASNNLAKAKEHYYIGVKEKDSAAMYRMGMMTLLGQHGEPKDYQTGLDRIREAADYADEDAPQGAYVYGMLIGRDLPDIYFPDQLLPQDMQLARMYIEKAAYLGFAKAQLKMGQAYELCQFGCEFNAPLSLHYYGLAARQGLPEAALGVSRWFLFGYEGVFRKNEELAYKYARSAAVQKLPTGEFALGYYNEIGIHVPKNVDEARKWYRLAADHGNKDAVGRLESLDQDHMLSKQDHETTTLTRIKSQHGSQRGKRPDRFKQQGAQQQQMATVSEDYGTPLSPSSMGSMLPARSNEASPRVSPQPSPGLMPMNDQQFSDYPENQRLSTGSNGPGRNPAFNIRLDNPMHAGRPQSAAPYPEDPRPLSHARPHSVAPYPEDDMQPGRGRPGVHSDRPGSGFGMQSGPGQRPLPASQSLNNLQPQARHADPRGRIVSQGYGGPHSQSPNPQSPTFSPDGYQGRPGSVQPYPSGNPAAARPSPNPQNFAPRGNARPDERFGTPVQGAGRMQSMPAQQDHRPPRMAAAQGRVPTNPQGGHDPARVGSAPPGAASRPPQPGPPPSSSTAPAKPSKGPATFEDMGIPQGKQDGDCVVM